MKAKKAVAVSSFAILAVATFALGTALGVVCRKVAVFDRKHGSDVLANLSASELFAKTNAVNKTVAPDAEEKGAQEDGSPDSKGPAELKIVNVSYEGDDEIVLSLSERPDMDVVRNYVKAEPLNEGRLTFRYTTPDRYVNNSWKTVPTLRIRVPSLREKRESRCGGVSEGGFRLHFQAQRQRTLRQICGLGALFAAGRTWRNRVGDDECDQHLCRNLPR